MQDREHERRRSRSRDRRRRERSDSREYYRGRRRDDSREYRRGRSRSLSRRRSPSFGRIPTPPKLIPREPEGPPPRWHYYGSGRGTSRDSEQSAWHERRYVSSSECPGASHFPRATGCLWSLAFQDMAPHKQEHEHVLSGLASRLETRHCVCRHVFLLQKHAHDNFSGTDMSEK